MEIRLKSYANITYLRNTMCTCIADWIEDVDVGHLVRHRVRVHAIDVSCDLFGCDLSVFGSLINKSNQGFLRFRCYGLVSLRMELIV